MTCLDVRRALLATPISEEPSLLAHLQDCTACRAFAADLKRQEAQLREALAVPVPAHLAERVLLATRLRRPRWYGLAWAASLLLAVMIGFSSYQFRPTSVAWCDVVLAHVLNERNTLEKDDEIPAQRLGHALAEFGLSAKGDLGQIRFLDRCALPGGRGLHVVIDTHELGQVTLILLPPGAHAAGEQMARDGFATKLVTIGDAVVGVVTQHPDQLEHLNHWLSHELQVLPG